MESTWNNFDLKKPPFVTLPSKQSRSILILHSAIDTYFRKHGQYEEEFNQTAALLSRLIARRKNSFNKMKGFKDICKLNSALSRLLRVDFKRDLDNFRNTLPDVDYEEGTCIQLPTRDSFDYLLLRLIAMYELYQRICDCCASAADYFFSQIRLCYFFDISTLLVAVMGKINNLSIKLINLAVDLYNRSLDCRNKLPVNVKSKFLKDKQFKFPEQLKMFGLSCLETKQNLDVEELPLKELLQQEEKLTPVKALKLKKTDVGLRVKRSVKAEVRTSFNIDQLNSVEKIIRFIASESKSRSTNLNAAITAKILSHEWAGATKLFERKVQSGEVKKAVNIFRKFLSSKIV